MAISPGRSFVSAFFPVIGVDTGSLVRAMRASICTTHSDAVVVTATSNRAVPAASSVGERVSAHATLRTNAGRTVIQLACKRMFTSWYEMRGPSTASWNEQSAATCFDEV
jgi:hypothetical protein